MDAAHWQQNLLFTRAWHDVFSRGDKVTPWRMQLANSGVGLVAASVLHESANFKARTIQEMMEPYKVEQRQMNEPF